MTSPLINHLLNTPLREVGSLDSANLLTIVRAPETPVTLLRILVNHPDHEVCAAAVENPSLPTEVLYELSAHDSQPVRMALARRRPLEFEIGCSLLRDRDLGVRRALALNPSTVPELLGRLLLDWSPEVRAAVASARQVTLTILHALVADPDPSVRRAIASSCKVTPDLLRRLAHDQSWDVREAVLIQEMTPTDAVVAMVLPPDLGERPCTDEIICSLLRERFGPGGDVPSRADLRTMLQSPSQPVKELARRLAIEHWQSKHTGASAPPSAESARLECPGATGIT